MAVIGTLTNSRKMRWIIYMVASAAGAVWFFYDGWFNPKYQHASEHSNMMFNRIGAVVLAVIFVVLVIRWFLIQKTRVVADDAGIEINGKFKIDYKSIVRMDDKNLEKGLLDIHYQEGTAERKYTLDNYITTNFEAMVEEIARHRPDLLEIESVEEKPTGEGDVKAGGK